MVDDWLSLMVQLRSSYAPICHVPLYMDMVDDSGQVRFAFKEARFLDIV